MNKKMKNRLKEEYGSEKKSKSKKEIEDFSISESTKTKTVALLIVLFAILIFLSIFSYNPDDYSVLTLNGFTTIFKSSNQGLHNLMGALGAYAAQYLVFNLFGYFSIAFSIV